MAQTTEIDSLIEPSARNLARFFTTFPRRTMCWDDVWAGDSELLEPMTNNAALLRPLDDASARGLTDRLDQFFAGASGGPWLLWSAWPTPDLAPLGYQLGGHPPLMARPAGTPPMSRPEGLRIEEVNDAEGLAAYERVLIDGFGTHETLGDMPPGGMLPPESIPGPARYWIGYADEVPVAAAAAVVGDGIVGIYAVATVPGARGKGYGGAVTDAAARCDPSLPAVLQASDMGRPVYERLGFAKVAEYTLWLRSRATR
jgi:GNAT superfamily N-acetyltransferase